MKVILLSALALLLTIATHGQKVYQIRADSVRIYNVCDTAELILENRTQNVKGFLFNKGAGRTEFQKLKLQALGTSRITIVGQDTLDLSSLPGIGSGVDTIYASGNAMQYVKQGKVYTFNAPPPFLFVPIDGTNPIYDYKYATLTGFTAYKSPDMPVTSDQAQSHLPGSTSYYVGHALRYGDYGYQMAVNWDGETKGPEGAFIRVKDDTNTSWGTWRELLFKDYGDNKYASKANLATAGAAPIAWGNIVNPPTEQDNLTTVLTRGNVSAKAMAVHQVYGAGAPTISLAVGDYDSGINAESDGVLTLRSNGLEIARWAYNTFSLTAPLSVNQIKLGANVTLSPDSTNAVFSVKNVNGNLTMGTRNPSYAHFTTNTGRFYFGSEVHVEKYLHIYNTAGVFDGYHLDLTAGDSSAIRFWSGSNTFSIGMSSTPGSGVPNVTPLGDNDYNMYFRMHGYNRGFVFIPGSDVPRVQIDNSGLTTNEWLRVRGKCGLFFQDYGGGWHMSDTTWIRAYNNKSVYLGYGITRTDGTLQVGINGQTLSVQDGGTATLFGNTIYHAGNLLFSSISTPNYLVQRDASGNVYANGFYQSSKASLKKNIDDFSEAALPLINQVKIKQFVYKDDKDENTRIGIIADSTDWHFSTKAHDKFDTNSSLAITMKAVQELSAQNQQMNKQNQQISKQNEELQAQNNELKNENNLLKKQMEDIMRRLEKLEHK
ncbi:shufflon system plasmid conjugative transfer pilus tip adhesin PilV [Chitinophaga sp. Hz27]|uniref:shufflon system plasmid conjugative transfer pilus tip adhesin PilV n=1 Tax=Chitinophaga sp. Hz27 TaxID=3347169 RepID=UPI0035DEA020